MQHPNTFEHSPTDIRTGKQANTPTNKHTKQLNREARWAIWLTLGYLVGWVVTAYFSPDGVGLLGFPLWFELSCLYLPVLFIIASFVVLKAVYQPIDFTTDLDNAQNGESSQPNNPHQNTDKNTDTDTDTNTTKNPTELP